MRDQGPAALPRELFPAQVLAPGNQWWWQQHQEKIQQALSALACLCLKGTHPYLCGLLHGGKLLPASCSTQCVMHSQQLGQYLLIHMTDRYMLIYQLQASAAAAQEFNLSARHLHGEHATFRGTDLVCAT